MTARENAIATLAGILAELVDRATEDPSFYGHAPERVSGIHSNSAGKPEGWTKLAEDILRECGLVAIDPALIAQARECDARHATAVQAGRHRHTDDDGDDCNQRAARVLLGDAVLDEARASFGTSDDRVVVQLDRQLVEQCRRAACEPSWNDPYARGAPSCARDLAEAVLAQIPGG